MRIKTKAGRRCCAHFQAGCCRRTLKVAQEVNLVTGFWKKLLLRCDEVNLARPHFWDLFFLLPPSCFLKDPNSCTAPFQICCVKRWERASAPRLLKVSNMLQANICGTYKTWFPFFKILVKNILHQKPTKTPSFNFLQNLKTIFQEKSKTARVGKNVLKTL